MTIKGIDVNNPTYRRYKVVEKTILKKDTIYDRFYYSLINENGKWKIIWLTNLLSFAEKKYADGNYSEARKTLEKIIEIDPFNGEAYQKLAWCYFRDQSLSRNEWKNGVVKNTKYALTLEEDNYKHYNTLAAYYSEIGNSDLAIQTYERGLFYCQNKDEKALLYSNIVGSYAEKRNFKKAEYYIKKAIETNPNNAFVWFKYGTLMMVQNKIDRVIEYFKKALKEDEMQKSLQGSLFYDYAVCCFEKNNCKIAKEYINKALDIQPDNNDYQAFYNKIKYCDTKIQ